MPSSRDEAMSILMKWKAGKVPVTFEMDLNFKMVARGSVLILPESNSGELFFGADRGGVRFSLALTKETTSDCGIDPTGAREVFLKLPGKFSLHFRQTIPLVSTAHAPVQ
jgi:hypothetical protein